jgi:hypothetical protein
VQKVCRSRETNGFFFGGGELLHPGHKKSEGANDRKDFSFWKKWAQVVTL